jgi:prepilin-type N-terminal cleavage/methylation domain-containing protein
MKRKGFTLLELIVAIAILLSGITAFGLASSVSLKVYKANQVKIQDINYADTIINIFKANGKLLVKNIHDKKDGISDASYYIYFDKSTILEKALEVYPTTFLSGAGEGTFTKCQEGNINSTNGAYISISKITDISSPGSGVSCNINDGDNNVNFYSVLIKVWNFQYGESSEVKYRIYMGR